MNITGLFLGGFQLLRVLSIEVLKFSKRYEKAGEFV